MFTLVRFATADVCTGEPADLLLTSSVNAAGKPSKKPGQLPIPVTEKAGRRWVEYRKLLSLDL